MFKPDLQQSTIDLIKQEIESIPVEFHKPFNSKHEGYAILLEEVRELEHVVFFGAKEAKKEAAEKGIVHHSVLHKLRLREEAVQIAAMAIRIIQELT